MENVKLNLPMWQALQWFAGQDFIFPNALITSFTLRRLVRNGLIENSGHSQIYKESLYRITQKGRDTLVKG